MNFEHTSEFQKELKRFSKKWPRLGDDLAIAQTVIATLYHGSNELNSEHIREMFFASKKGAVLQSVSETAEVVKMRVDSQDLNRDMLRIVYIRVADTIYFVEIFAKNDKPREDKSRIKYYLKELAK